jgi:hypothetical protein
MTIEAGTEISGPTSMVSVALLAAYIDAGAPPAAQVLRRICRKDAGELRFANAEIGQTITGRTNIGAPSVLPVLPGDQRLS